MLDNVLEGEQAPKLRPARDSDKLLVARIVRVTLPAFEHHGQSWPELAVNMKWAVRQTMGLFKLNHVTTCCAQAWGWMFRSFEKGCRLDPTLH